MRLILIFCLAWMIAAAPAYAQCTDPTGVEGDQTYNLTYKTMVFCDGTNWHSMKAINAGLRDDCTNNEVLKWDGSDWSCAADSAGTGGDNLGDHAATQDVDLANHNVKNAAGVQIGNATTCGATEEGTIRYTGGSPPWQFCDGGAWVNFKQPRCQDDDTGECYLDATRSNDDPDFTAANIADGVNILGVTGTYTGSGGCTAPASCANIGDVCSDGSIFAGFMLYGTSCEPLYVTDNNQSLSSQWKTATGTNDITDPDDFVDGQYNRNNRGSGTFPAFELCEDNTYHGKSDWYLPASVELKLLWLNRAAIDANAAGNFTTSYYWSSTESGTGSGRLLYFGGGSQNGSSKTTNYDVRCVRRD